MSSAPNDPCPLAPDTIDRVLALPLSSPAARLDAEVAAEAAALRRLIAAADPACPARLALELQVQLALFEGRMRQALRALSDATAPDRDPSDGAAARAAA